MSVAPGSRIGPYEVVGSLGAGGMGEVYRARDARLNRDVAVKLLPAALAADPDRPARFAREAQLLASLNHPNIAHVLGVVDLPGDGVSMALVMELVEGPTLADRLRRGRIEMDEAIAIARQLIDAIEAAHAQGVVHRDLKPANIKVREDGTVKVLDFGLAKLAAPDGADSDAALANSPTLTAQSTQFGMILGTAAYMAPEQAKGKPADKRADIWAFGVVLFEMLSGRQLFAGDTTSEVLAGVLKEQPDWTALPAATSTSIRRLLARCLEKDPKRRLRDIGDARLELDESANAPLGNARTSPRRSIGPLIAAAAAGAAVMAAVMIFALPRWQRSAVAPLQRLSILPAEGAQLYRDSAEHAISPDGLHVVFRTGRLGQRTNLWLRTLDSAEPRLLAGTTDAHLPFWSPDGTKIAFFHDNKLKAIALSTGAVTTICNAPDGRGGAWSPDGTIVFAPSNAVGLMRVSADGGDPRQLTSLDVSSQERAHRFPWFLPDGRHFLYVALIADRMNVYAASVDDSQRKLLMSASSAAVYADPGYLLFMRPTGLAAQRFDAATLTLSGEPVTLPDTPGAIGSEWVGAWPVTVSRTGAMMFLADPARTTRLIWYDLVAGKESETLPLQEGYYDTVKLAPDEKHALVGQVQSTVSADIWLVDLARGGATKLTDGTLRNRSPLWSPDGARIAYVRERNGVSEIHAYTLGGGHDELLLGNAGLFVELESWSPDGKTILYSVLDPVTQRDIWALPLEGDRKPWPYLNNARVETLSRFSPDGKYVSYLGREAAVPDIFVQSFPKPGEKYAVTSGGAGFGGFDPSGSIEYGVLNDPRVYRVTVTGRGPLQFGAPTVVAMLPPRVISQIVSATPTRDRKRLLALMPGDAGGVTSLTLVNNWRAALPRRP